MVVLVLRDNLFSSYSEFLGQILQYYPGITEIIAADGDWLARKLSMELELEYQVHNSLESIPRNYDCLLAITNGADPIIHGIIEEAKKEGKQIRVVLYQENS